MTNFNYDRSGRQLNGDIDLIGLVDDEPTEGGQPMETHCDPISGHGNRLDRFYMTLAGAVMGRIKTEKLDKRKLASGLIVYSTERNVRLEPGVEAVSLPYSVVALNFNDFIEPPEEVRRLSYDHTLWVAQSLIDYDFGVQHERRKIESRQY